MVGSSGTAGKRVADVTASARTLPSRTSGIKGEMAPTGTPPAIIEKIHQDSVKALAPPEVRKRLSDIGMEVIGNSPKEFAAAMAVERPQWAKVIKDAGIAASD